MTWFAPLLLALAQAAPTPPVITMAPAPLPLAQQTALKCSVAIAIASERQKQGKGDPAWPDLSVRGREFFVRSLAKLMDDTGLPREGVALHARGEVKAFQAPGALEQVMPACLALLDASGV